MPPPRARWSNLVVGIGCVAALAFGALAVLRYARVGALRGDTVRLYARTGLARGVFPGTDVWLEGRKIGVVASVRFRPPSTDTLERLLVELDILGKDVGQIRRDSWAQIRPGGTLIGTPVIWVRAGSIAAAPLSDGDTLSMRPQGDTEDVMSKVAVATAELPKIMANVQGIMSSLDSARGSAGAVLGDEGGMERIALVGGRAAGLVTRATSGSGTTGLFLRRGRRDLVGRARAAMAGVDSLRALLATPGTSVGRFRRDSTLARSIGDLRNEVSIVRALLAEPRGTAGRVLGDSAVFDQLGRAQRELGVLMQDVKKRPLRYLSVTL